MTSWNGSFSVLLAICVGDSRVSGEFPPQRASKADFDAFMWVRLSVTNSLMTGDLRLHDVYLTSS